MSRTYVITGAASGIGRAAAELLTSQGHRVIGVDLRGSDIDLDLSDAEQRATVAERVQDVLSRDHATLDAVLAVAGVALPTALTVRVNYFGAVATLESLQPLLTTSPAPRAVVVASFSTLQENDPELVDSMLDGDEVVAAARADQLAAAGRGHLIYASTKRAVAEWMRRQSVSDTWAGAGIPLNGVGPGVVLTPMTAPLLQTEGGRAQLVSGVPMPLHGPAEPVVIARALAWLSSEENSHATGQLLFVDGGADVVVRGPRVFGTPA